MKKLLCVALLLLSACYPTNLETVSTSYVAPEPRTEESILIGEALASRAFDKYQAFLNACFYTPYSCIGVSVPKVVYMDMRPGLYGYYDGTDTIYVRSGLRGTLRKEVLMHETVHYLQVQRGGLEVPGYAEPICRAENEAFTVVDEWLIDINKPNLVVGPDWWRPYSHCHKFYNPDYPSFNIWDRTIADYNPYGK